MFVFTEIRLRLLFFFFFQAEDGIRDWSVTGVQTCALPIFPAGLGPSTERRCDCPNRAPQPVQSLVPPAPADTVPPRRRLGRPPLCSGGATPDHTRRCPAPA